METREIKELIEQLKGTEYGYIDIRHEGSQILLSKTVPVRESAEYARPEKETAEVSQGKSIQTEIPAAFKPAENAVTNNKEEEANCEILKSPMVGTFYESPSPEAEAFIKVGDKVKKGDTLCIIEAMKLMNEIEAECSGTIIEILVDNEAVVEYNQPLFKIKAD